MFKLWTWCWTTKDEENNHDLGDDVDSVLSGLPDADQSILLTQANLPTQANSNKWSPLIVVIKDTCIQKQHLIRPKVAHWMRFNAVSG